MAALNAKYGSELHLLRMLGRHRDYFDRRVREVTGADAIEWLDFPSGETRRDEEGRVLWDREWQHVQFLDDGDPARKAWDAAWPTHRVGPNWDAIGRLRYGTAQEWLLVEAKANVQELKSECRATGRESVDLIRNTLDRTKAALGVAATADWLRPYYQFCNRLAVLHVLNSAETPARLLFVYFHGDTGDARRTCPAPAAAWDEPLAELHRHVGLPATHPLCDRIHSCRIDAQCQNETVSSVPRL
jgi:hypothetical protein